VSKSYDTYHLAVVVRASRLGRVEFVRPVAYQGEYRANDYPIVRVLTMRDKQTEAKLLAATMDHPGANEFASADHLKTAVLACAAAQGAAA
jgi:hypothetical protein